LCNNGKRWSNNETSCPTITDKRDTKIDGPIRCSSLKLGCAEHQKTCKKKFSRVLLSDTIKEINRKNGGKHENLSGKFGRGLSGKSITQAETEKKYLPPFTAIDMLESMKVL
jgi:hypothetical protein